MGLPIANENGVPHLHIIGLPDAEASELKAHVEGMRSKNVDHASAPVFNPAVSKAQFSAMQAAKHGHSTLGIPESVGAEFAPSGVKRPKGLPSRVRPSGR